MQIKIQGRQTGKTYDIAQIMKKDKNAICIRPTYLMCETFCKIYGIKRERVFTISELLKQKESIDLNLDVNIYVDEIGLCLQLLLSFKGNIAYGTHTN